jgi:hypothetical protein
MALEYPLPYLQEPVIGPYPEPCKSSKNRTILFVQDPFLVLSSHPTGARVA